jgi:predicted nucleotidyltransferase
MISPASIKEVAHRIVRAFNPERIILFGSHAYGTPGPDSDVDLLVVLPFEGKAWRKAAEILNHINVGFPLDLIARRPEDMIRRYREGDPLIVEAVDRGKVLYEAPRHCVVAVR